VDVGVSTGAPCDALSILDGTCMKIRKQAIVFADSTDTGQLHFALGSLGSYILST
jgi:hypothetical protein